MSPHRNRTRRVLPAFLVRALLALLWVALGVGSVEARHRQKSPDTTEPPASPAAAPPAAPPPTAPAPEATPVAPPAAAAPPAGAVNAATADSSQDPCLSNAECSQMYERARTLSRANQYEAALVLYQQTYAMKPLPWLLLNIGRMQQKLVRPDQAAATYRKILDWNAKLPADETSGLADAEVLAKAREYLKQAEDALAEQKKNAPVPVVLNAGVDKAPIYKKWWFWTIIGGSAALVAVGVGLGVGLSGANSGPRVPSGVDVFYPNF